jgi:hypothetical protein
MCCEGYEASGAGDVGGAGECAFSGHRWCEAAVDRCEVLGYPGTDADSLLSAGVNTPRLVPYDDDGVSPNAPSSAEVDLTTCGADAP